MKPVHRRILFAMNELGLNPDTPFRKCARVVGEVLGKYHPHGDTAVYDALVRMAQDFSMRSILIAGHGNFGSIDHDPAAAMRYTECKISKLSKEVILKDIGKKTTDFINNFDGSCREPSVLPSRIPTILLNGSSGIAVGMSTNIPPHNLTEISKGMYQLIQNPRLDDDTLLKLIPAPDFPTGGSIIGLHGCSRLYRKGQGSIIVRAKTYFESTNLTKHLCKQSIIVSELPFQVNKTSLITKIAELVNEKIIEGIVDLRDESDRNGIRIVIELKKDTNQDVILNNLFKKTPLQTSFGGHLLALVGRQPATLTLKELLLLFIQFRKKTIRRRLQYELNESIEKIHSINGLILTLNAIEFVLAVVQKSKNNTEARTILIESGFTQNQSEAVLNIQLRRLTRLEFEKLNQEYKTLNKIIYSLKKSLAFPQKLQSLIKKELEHVIEIFGMPRRTNLIHSKTNGFIDEIQMVDNYSTIVMVTKFFIKRMVIETFESQNRGTRGKKGVSIQENDEISHFFSCKNHDSLLCVLQNGVAYAFRAYQIPISRRTARGISLANFLPTPANGKISSVISISEFSSQKYLILLTKNGMIKKTPLIAFQHISARGLTVLSVEKNDQLCWVRKCSLLDSILISTKRGKALRFLTDEIQLRATGRNSKGKRSMNLTFDDKIIDVDVISSNANETKAFIIAITINGFGKRMICNEFKIQNRGGKGIKIIKWKKTDNDELISVRFCQEKEEIFLITQKGTIVRQKTIAVPIQKRAARGVKVQNLIPGDLVSKTSLI
jgi:DNA gyrase subunit A